MSSLYLIDNEIIELLENGFNMACIDAETGEIDEQKAQAYLVSSIIPFLQNTVIYLKGNSVTA